MRLLSLLFINISIFSLIGCVGDDENIPEISIEDALTVSEPDSGDIELEVPLKLDRNGDNSILQVSVELEHVSTTENDVQLMSQEELTLSSNNSDDSVKLLIRSDSFVEAKEYFKVNISSSDISVIGATATVELEDATPPTEVSFQASTSTIAEGTGSQSVNIDVTNPSETDSILAIFSFSGTATLSNGPVGGDYQVHSTELEIPAGATSAALPISVIDDGLSEGGESIVVSMSTPGYKNMVSETVIFIPGDLAINDTGTVNVFNGTGFQTVSSTDYPDQDAEIGLDVGSSDVDGKAGFRLTRLDNSGNAVPAGDPFRCVKDENTGLTWEVKTAATSIPAGDPSMTYSDFVKEEVRLSKLDADDADYQAYGHHGVHAQWQSVNYRYYWLNNNQLSNGGAPGTEGPAGYPKYMMQRTCAFPNETQASYSEKTNNCNSAQYVEYASDIAVCGVKDWRLPTIEELRSLVNYDSSEEGLDSSYFPSMNAYTYMSSTPYSRERGSFWCLDARSKRVQLCNKQSPNSLILVRGGNQ